MAEGHLTVMDDDGQITQGELRRFMSRMEQTLTELGHRIDTALSTKVGTERYEAEMAEVRRNQAETDRRIDKMLEKADRWKLALFTAIAAPIIVSLALLAYAAQP